MNARFDQRLAEAAASVDAVTATAIAGPEAARRPPRLVEAMRYAALSPGKRLRPFLVIETARLFGVSGPAVLRAASAIECVHAYSLVHDDLPAMDDDDFRRGRPTVHRAFDEATAILAGDALLTLAFEMLATIDAPADARLALVRELAQASGADGMVGGQQRDLEAEKRQRAAAEIRQLQAMKTGALLEFSVTAGAMLGRAPEAERQHLARYGRAIGAAFQVADDILDVTSTPAALGKATAKDQKRGKATLIAVLGLERARAVLDGLVEEAVQSLRPFGERAAVLGDAARFIAAPRA
ncbi:MAG TPA: farnesyl diphosphate synthase [Bauldia sp.]|nr:farnesyl diphosphate synthase [Bauldia sp.]